MHDLALTNDVIFKLVFGAEKHEAILRGLLNAILGLSGPQRISQIKVLNPNLDKINVSHKGCILDIKAQDIRGRRFNVEVQVSREPEYINRSLYYLTRLFSEQPQSRQGDHHGLKSLSTGERFRRSASNLRRPYESPTRRSYQTVSSTQGGPSGGRT